MKMRIIGRATPKPTHARIVIGDFENLKAKTKPIRVVRMSPTAIKSAIQSKAAECEVLCSAPGLVESLCGFESSFKKN